ncbi:hypothetical protein JQC67_09615 [Aurantibacter crassamenti]|uniref:hypothetical protein n=1 Tax=Aurantibacter crassamenti TaxID=1837375 RepID=UPI001939B523|nr:hypothetical protein [Aurantibacter crassamenti]MBM1106393.1 hypothetical protein [Aurantibacter crassamenti]
MVYFKHLKVFVIFLFVIGYGQAQTVDCTLDIGGKTAESVTVIFQLNEEQKQLMEELRAKYSITYKGIEDEMIKLLAEHPQSTPEELLTLAEKYKALQDKVVLESWSIDEKLLATFNQRQYDFYLSLCHEAYRRPIEVTPVIYDGPLEEKK